MVLYGTIHVQVDLMLFCLLYTYLFELFKSMQNSEYSIHLLKMSHVIGVNELKQHETENNSCMSVGFSEYK